MVPSLDPENKAKLICWAADNFNDQSRMIKEPLEIDFDSLVAYQVEIKEKSKEEQPQERDTEGAETGKFGKMSIYS